MGHHEKSFISHDERWAVLFYTRMAAGAKKVPAGVFVPDGGALFALVVPFVFHLARHGGEAPGGAFFRVECAAGFLAQFLAGDEFGHGRHFLSEIQRLPKAFSRKTPVPLRLSSASGYLPLRIAWQTHLRADPPNDNMSYPQSLPLLSPSKHLPARRA